MVPKEGRATVLEASDAMLGPGLYDLRVFPQLRIAGCIPAGDLGQAMTNFAKGNWPSALKALKRVEAQRMRKTDGEGCAFGNLANALETLRHARFKKEMRRIADSARALEKGKARDHCFGEFVARVAVFIDSDPHPAPVFLDDPARTNEDFSFAVAGDVHLHKDVRYAGRFFALLNARESPRNQGRPYEEWSLEEKLGEDSVKLLRNLMSEEEIGDWVRSIGRERVQAVAAAKFAVIVGDCVDGASGQAPLSWAANVAGLMPVTSPYAGKELELFRGLVSSCKKPIFAVPGNHDAAAGHPGLLTLPLDLASWAGICLHRDKGAGFLRGLGDFIPGLVRMSFFGLMPLRYDGLVDWEYQLGLPNNAFVYRGRQFVLLNSFHLDKAHRATAGGVALNTGGGMHNEDVAWMQTVLETWRNNKVLSGRGESASPQEFLFMHHDPRGGQPTRSGTEEKFGIYEAIDTPVAVMTFGYGGLFSYSTRNGVFIPIVSVGLEYLYRAVFGVEGGLTAREWMRRCSLGDSEAYGAKPLLKAINSHLAGTYACPGISELFFAHNNYFLETQWLRDPASRWLFRTPGTVQWTGSERPLWETAFLLPFATKDAQEPPKWAQEMRVPEGLNAKVVRLDDVSDTFFDRVHGFSVVTVSHCGPNKTDYISLPATSKPVFK